MNDDTSETPWYGVGADDNVAMLADYMAEHGHTAASVAYMVGKPWKFEDLYREALVESAREDAEFQAQYPR